MTCKPRHFSDSTATPIIDVFRAAGLVLALTACGGGGADSADPAIPATATSPLTSIDTFFLKTQNTVRYIGKDYGLARLLFQTDIDFCNAYRATEIYGLPAISPPEAVLAQLDVSVQEKSLDKQNGLALTLSTGVFYELPDMKRWLQELEASAIFGKFPAVPPDCSKLSISEYKTGTLFKNGLEYRLRYGDQTASVSKDNKSPPPPLTQSEFASLPIETVLSEPCRFVTLASGLTAKSTGCIWNVLPYLQFLNWPFTLKGELAFPLYPDLVERVEPLEIKRSITFPAWTFEVPAGFTVKGSTP